MTKTKCVLKAPSDIEDWKRELSRILTTASPNSNIAIVGIGHSLRGDDYVGSHIAKTLRREFGRGRAGITLFNGEEGVETIIHKVARLNPKHVVFIDACEMNRTPGEIHLVSMAQTDYPFFTTHGIPMKLLVEQFLPNCQAWVLAIQPELVEFSEVLSARVGSSARAVVEFVLSLREERASA